METQLPILFAVSIAVFEAVWRRSHGGGLFHDVWDKYVYPYIKVNYRIPSVLVHLAVWFSVGMWMRDMEWWMAAAFSLVLWAFWDITFGMYMGIGCHDYPSDEDKREYARQYPVVWVLDYLLPFSDSHDPIWGKYGVCYDFCGMWLRFTYPAIPLVVFMPEVFSPWLLAIGLIVAVNYYVAMWVWSWWNTELASGFFAGLFFTLI